MKTRAELPHLYYPAATMQRRQINAHAFPSGGGGGLPVTAGLIFHLDASEASSVTLNGSNVSAIADLSSVGVSVTQVTSARQPAYVTAGLNGLNVMRFTAASAHFLDVASITIPASHTVFVVINRGTAGINSIALGRVAGGRYSTWWYNDNVAYQQSNANFTTHGTANTSTGAFVMTTRRNGTSQIRVRRNGTTVADVTTGGGVTSAASGTWDCLGRDGGTYSTGDIGEVIAYDASLSDGDVDSVEAYLTAKWI
jgi:hypothetical protein